METEQKPEKKVKEIAPKKFGEKLLEAQQEIIAIPKTSENPYFKSFYADINAILAIVKPILNKQGLVLTQALDAREGRNGLLTAILNASTGEKVESYCFLPDLADPQKFGASVTYYRRYAVQSILALEAAEDDDGNLASGKKIEVKGGVVYDKKTGIVSSVDSVTGLPFE